MANNGSARKPRKRWFLVINGERIPVSQKVFRVQNDRGESVYVHRTRGGMYRHISPQLHTRIMLAKLGAP